MMMMMQIAQTCSRSSYARKLEANSSKANQRQAIETIAPLPRPWLRLKAICMFDLPQALICLLAFCGQTNKICQSTAGTCACQQAHSSIGSHARRPATHAQPVPTRTVQHTASVVIYLGEGVAT